MIDKIAVTLLLLLISIQPVWAQESDKTQEPFREHAPLAGPAPVIQLGDFEQFVLANGLQVVLVENHKLPQVAFHVLIDVPPIEEGPKAGAAVLAGALLSRGTLNRTKAEIDEAIDFIGAEFSTQQNEIFGRCLSRHKLQLLDIMQDVLLKPAFPDAEFEKVQQQQLSNLALQQSTPDFIAKNVGRALCYDDHPYGEVMTKESLQNITIEDCKSYYNTYFKPNISYLAIVGDIDLVTAKKLAHQYFGKWEKGEVLKKDFQKPGPPSPTEIDFVQRDGAVQSIINITYPINLKPGTEDAIVASVLNTTLGEGTLNSRLNKKIREEKGYSYGLRSTLRYDKHIGFFSAGGSLRNEVTDSAIVIFLEEMQRLRTEEMPEEELERVKAYILGYFARSVEQPLTLARFALNMAEYKLPADFYSDYLKKLEEVSVQDVKAVAQKYLLPDQAHIVVVGSQAVLSKLDSMPIAMPVKHFDIDGRITATKKSSIPEGVTAQMLVEQYLEAIGGQEKLEAINDQYLKMAAGLSNMRLEVEIFKKIPNKWLQQSRLNGNMISELRFNGHIAASTIMGQHQAFGEAEMELLRMQSALFPELSILQGAYSLELAGLENVEGEMAYHILVTTSKGKVFHYYYDQQTNLKVKAVHQQKNLEGQDIKVINTYSDYKPVDGILIPYKVTSAGVAPYPVTFKVESVIHNSGLKDSLFEKE